MLDHAALDLALAFESPWTDVVVCVQQQLANKSDRYVGSLPDWPRVRLSVRRG